MASAPRIVGLDAARGLAVLGMFVAHTAPVPLDVDTIADGRSSILFATVAGVSLGLLSGGAQRLAERRGETRRRIAIRGIVLVLLGFWLAVLGSLVSIILDEYGVMYLLLLPVLFAPRRVLVPLGLVVATLGPLLIAAMPAPTDAVSFAIDELIGPSASYPILLWLAYLIAGLVVARSDLARPLTQYATVAVGLVGMLLGYGLGSFLGLDVSAHSDTTAEAFGSGGLALVVIGASAWLLGPERGAFGRIARAALSPLTATGSMPLTVYTAQIVVLAVVAGVARSTGAPYGRGEYPLVLLVGLVVGSLVFAWLWRRFLGRGPLESALASLTAPIGGPAARPEELADPAETGRGEEKRMSDG